MLAATFEVFARGHVLAVGSLLLTTAALVSLGRRWRGTPKQRLLEGSLAVLALLLWLVCTVVGLMQAPVEVALPLHLCDITALLAPFVLWRPRPLPRALVYFWGLAVSTQAVITPDITVGPDTAWFWAFWAEHTAIVLAAAWDVLVRRWRPRWRDWLAAVLCGLLYVAIVLPLDQACGWNYGYLADRLPVRATLLDHLGPWPLRVVWIVLLGMATTAALMLPWTARKSPATSPQAR